MAQTQEFIATGRRKTSVARIRMTPGSGKIDIKPEYIGSGADRECPSDSSSEHGSGLRGLQVRGRR